jgi:hypothetical protein
MSGWFKGELSRIQGSRGISNLLDVFLRDEKIFVFAGISFPALFYPGAEVFELLTPRPAQIRKACFVVFFCHTV